MNHAARQQFLTCSLNNSGAEPSPLPTSRNTVAVPSSNEQLPKHVSNEQFQAMIPAHFTQPPAPADQKSSSSIVINVKQPDPVGTLSEMQFPPVPTQLGQVTETITKSTLTETIVTRVTNNKLGALPIIIEVNSL